PSPPRRGCAGTASAESPPPAASGVLPWRQAAGERVGAGDGVVAAAALPRWVEGAARRAAPPVAGPARPPGRLPPGVPAAPRASGPDAGDSAPGALVRG